MAIGDFQIVDSSNYKIKLNDDFFPITDFTNAITYKNENGKSLLNNGVESGYLIKNTNFKENSLDNLYFIKNSCPPYSYISDTEDLSIINNNYFSFLNNILNKTSLPILNLNTKKKEFFINVRMTEDSFHDLRNSRIDYGGDISPESIAMNTTTALSYRQEITTSLNYTNYNLEIIYDDSTQKSKVYENNSYLYDLPKEIYIACIGGGGGGVRSYKPAELKGGSRRRWRIYSSVL